MRKSRVVPDSVKAMRQKAHSETQQVNVLSFQDAVYLAGVLDGEGGISIVRLGIVGPSGRKRLMLKVSITNTHEPFMDWVAKTVGFGKIYSKGHNQVPRRKPCWEWKISGKRAIHFLRQIFPFLIIKKEQAKIAFEFGKTLTYPANNRICDTILDVRDNLREQLKSLNN